MVLIAGITAHGLSGGLWPQHESGDWRGAIAATRALTNEDPTAVLLRSRFFEAANPEWLADPNYQGLLLAPLSAYPLDRPVIVLPYEVNPETAPYLNKTLAPLTSRRRIVLIARFGGKHPDLARGAFRHPRLRANSSQPPRGRLGPGL